MIILSFGKIIVIDDLRRFHNKLKEFYSEKFKIKSKRILFKDGVGS